jgi:hypothetical protein
MKLNLNFEFEVTHVHYEYQNQIKSNLVIQHQNHLELSKDSLKTFLMHKFINYFQEFEELF